MVFEIARQGPRTKVKITHAGLVPQFECFEACSGGWNFYLNESLKRLIETGTGEPDETAKAAA